MTGVIEVERPAPGPMDFQSFLAWSAQTEGITGIERLCETRIAKAFSELPPPLNSEGSARLHRCDMARLWCVQRGLPELWAKNALTCEGVRHALQIIFATLAERATAVALPSDVYPVYWKLALSARLRAQSFSTFPRFELGTTLADLAKADVTVALLPLPLKLQGRAWTEAEVAVAEEWLSRRRGRRLILDAVYSMGAPLDPLLKRLFETGQVILLDSLSKGWLREQIFGVAVVPDADFELYSGAFRALVPSNQKLSVARELLTQCSWLPARIAQHLERRRAGVISRLSELKLKTLPVRHGYLIPIEASAEMLLSEHSLLTIPASVFGSRLTDWSVASVLPSQVASL